METPTGQQLPFVPQKRLPISGHGQLSSALPFTPQGGYSRGNKQALESDRLGFESQVHSLLAETLVNSRILPDPPSSHLENGTRTTHFIAQLLEIVSPMLGVKGLTGPGMYEALEKGSHPNR